VKAKNLFKTLNVPFKAAELDEMGQQGTAIQSELKALTKQSTVPNIFIKQQHVGGCDSVHALHAQNKLLPML
jgi:glutaredoxin 3